MEKARKEHKSCFLDAHLKWVGHSILHFSKLPIKVDTVAKTSHIVLNSEKNMNLHWLMFFRSHVKQMQFNIRAVTETMRNQNWANRHWTMKNKWVFGGRSRAILGQKLDAMGTCPIQTIPGTRDGNDCAVSLPSGGFLDLRAQSFDSRWQKTLMENAEAQNDATRTKTLNRVVARAENLAPILSGTPSHPLTEIHSKIPWWLWWRWWWWWWWWWYWWWRWWWSWSRSRSLSLKFTP